MADITGLIGGDHAVPFMVSAGLVYEIIAAACSSPQTTEINAGTRADTLMKWVHLGLFQAALFVGIAAFITDSPTAVIAGGLLGAALMYWSYLNALDCGLREDLPGTEH